MSELQRELNKPVVIDKRVKNSDNPCEHPLSAMEIEDKTAEGLIIRCHACNTLFHYVSQDETKDEPWLKVTV